MSWEFLYLQRDVYQGDRNWGLLYIITAADEWEKLCYSYELPWRTYQSGANEGKSVNSQSRIKIGNYELKPRSDGPKGWRLELQNTGHRSNIQIHRAHKSMYIEGCILPVHFYEFSASGLQKGDPEVQSKSVELMNSIKSRYDALKSTKTGNPTIEIAAKLPAQIDDGTRAA
jgi:hypothetical protein